MYIIKVQTIFKNMPIINEIVKNLWRNTYFIYFGKIELDLIALIPFWQLSDFNNKVNKNIPSTIRIVYA